MTGARRRRRAALALGFAIATFPLRFATVAGAEPPGADRERVAAALAALADDPDVRVRFQAALSLGSSDAPDRDAALARIARRDADDPWVRRAVLASAGRNPSGVAEAWLAGDLPRETPGAKEFLADLARTVGARAEPVSVADFVALVADRASRDGASAAWIAVAGLGGLDAGLKLAEGADVASPRAALALEPLAGSPVPEIAKAARALAGRLVPSDLAERTARALERLAVARDAARPAAERVAALDALAPDDLAGRLAELGELLAPAEGEEVRVAAIRALGRATLPESGVALLERFRSLAPESRGPAMDAIFARADRLAALLDAVEAERIPATAVDSVRRAQLRASPDPAVAERAARLLADRPSEYGAQIFERYRPALDLAGDPAKGAKIHEKRCAQCHRAGGIGFQVGPDWASVKANPPEKTLLSILDPNQSIAGEYTNFAIETEGGRLATGLVVSSTPAGVVLRRGGGEEETILRRNILSMTDTRLSIMPEGLEDGLSVEDMADLLAFLATAE